MDETKEIYIDVKTVADTLGCSISHATNLVRRRIKHTRLDPKKKQSPYRIPASAFRAYLAETLVTPAEPTKPPPPRKSWPANVKRIV